MKSPKAIARAAVIAFLITSTAAFGSGVNVQTFLPRGNTEFVFSENAVPERGSYFLSAGYNFSNDSLVELDPTRETRLSTIVDGIQTLDLMAGVRLSPTVTLDAGVPLNYVHLTNQDRKYALGDVRLFSKIFLLKAASNTGLSLIPEIRLPTGKPDLFVSNDSLGYGMTFALEHQFDWLNGVLNVGYFRASSAIFRDMDYRQQFPVSLGGLVKLTPKIGINVEGSRDFVLPLNGSQNPGELYAGARYAFAPGWVADGGGSVGTLNTTASANYRFLVAIKYLGETSVANESVPGEPRAVPQPISANEPAAPRIVDVLPTRQARAVLTPKGIELANQVGFEHASSRLTEAAKQVLDEVAEVIQQNLKGLQQVTIEGHTNELGSDKYNLKLSWARARSVKDYLASRGVDDGLLLPQGYGKRRPLPGSANLPREERLRVNRRVEFKVQRKPGLVLNRASNDPGQDDRSQD